MLIFNQQRAHTGCSDLAFFRRLCQFGLGHLSLLQVLFNVLLDAAVVVSVPTDKDGD